MSEEKQPTAAELLTEWKSLEDYRIHLRNDRDDRFSSLKESMNGEKMDAIAAQLDEMCINAGIAFIEGQFWYARKFFSVVIEPEPYLLREVCDPYFSNIYREWLLIKESGLVSQSPPSV